jgi:uncharacterized membrane protein
MLIWLIIGLYVSMAVVDVMDKFLISKRKIKPISYTFFTVVTGALLLLIWPWVYESLPLKFIGLDLFSGAFFGLTIYVFFKALSFGEASRVVAFIFGMVPVFDIFLSFATGRGTLTVQETAAIALLVPGAFLISYYPHQNYKKHLSLKLLAAFLFSAYNLLWQYGAQEGSSLNNLMWNRIGAALPLILLLLVPSAKSKIFDFGHVAKKAHTSLLFAAKQALGGLNFIFLSYLLTATKIAIVDGLSGFRYAFLFILGLLLSGKRTNVLEEDIGKKVIWQKSAALALIFLGTLILFI